MKKNRLKRWIWMLLTASLILDQCAGAAIPAFASEGDALEEAYEASEGREASGHLQAENPCPAEHIGEGYCAVPEGTENAGGGEEPMPEMMEIIQEKAGDSMEASEDADPLPAAGTGEEIEWGDYTAIRDDENATLTLTKYKGTVSSLTVPAVAVIGSKSYKIVIKSDCIYDEDGERWVDQSIWAGDENLTSISFGEGFEAPKDSSGLFANCGYLESIDLKNFDTSNVTSMGSMFDGCSSLAELDVSGFDTSQVTNMEEMFDVCSRLAELDVSGFDTSNVTSMRGMFSSCSRLAELDVSGFDTSKVIDMGDMFRGCKSLAVLDVSGLDTSKVTDMSWIFSSCASLASVDLSGLDTSKVTDMRGIFNDCRSLTSVDLSGLDTSKVKDMGDMFRGCKSLAVLDVSGFDTSKVTDMGGMFSSCASLSSVDLSGLDTSNVTSMGSMFNGCSSLAELDLSGLDTSQVTNMGDMFNGCASLTVLDLSGFDTSQVTFMGRMFEGCSSLAGLDLREFDTSQVTYMEGMFRGCEGLSSVDLSNFDTSSVTKMWDMFFGCSSLTALDLSSFDLSNLSDPGTDRFFYNTPALSTIKTPNKTGNDTPKSLYGKFSGGGYENITRIPQNLTSSIVLTRSSMIPLESLSAYSTEHDVYIGSDSWNYYVGFVPENATDQRLAWSSEDESIAVVDSKGNVTGLKEGSTTVTARSVSDPEKSVEFTVHVSYKEIRGMTLNASSLSVKQGETIRLSVRDPQYNKHERFIDPACITWTISGDPAVASVDEKGYVSANKPGKVTITAAYKGDESVRAACELTVTAWDPSNIRVAGVKLNKKKAEISLNGILQLTAIVRPSNASNKKVAWSSSSNEIAEVDNSGAVTGKAVGTTYITATTEDGGFADSCKVSVVAKPEPTPGPTPGPTPEPTPGPAGEIFTVTFMSGNEVFLKAEVKAGQTVSEPAARPARDGFLFAGWTKGTALWNFSTPIHSDLILDAKFIPAGGVPVSSNTGSGRDPVPVEDAGTVYLVKGQSFTLAGEGFSITEGQDVIKLSKKSGTVTARKKGKAAVSDGTKSMKFVVAAPYFEQEARKLALIVGATKDLSGLFKLDSPEEGKAEMYPVTWDSSNPKVASAYGGNVTALAKGSAKIRAYVGGKTYSCSLTVTDTYKAPKKLTGKDDAFSMNPLQSFQLKYDKGAFTVKNATWTISPDAVAEISPSGRITAKGTGTAKISGKDTKGRTAGFTVTVSPVPAKENTYINAGKKETIKFPFVKNKKGVWDSSDKSVISSYANGTVKGAKTGSSRVSCSINGFVFSTMVYVESPEFETDDKLVKNGNKYALALKAGEAYRIRMKNVYQTINYSSSKKSVAFVDENGFVYARKPGKANITAKINGKTYKISVKVE